MPSELGFGDQRTWYALIEADGDKITSLKKFNKRLQIIVATSVKYSKQSKFSWWFAACVMIDVYVNIAN